MCDSCRRTWIHKKFKGEATAADVTSLEPKGPVTGAGDGGQ